MLLVVLLAGCEQVTSLLGLRTTPVVRREPRTPRPEESPATRAPQAQSTPLIFPNASPGAGIVTPGPVVLATANPATNPGDPTSAPGASITPWMTAKLTEVGNGLQKMEITGSGGWGADERVDTFALASLDGEVYLLVLRWRIWFWGNTGPCDGMPEIYRWDAPAAVFKVRRVTEDAVALDFVGKTWHNEQSLRAGWESGMCGGGSSGPFNFYDHVYRNKIVESLRDAMPATESLDVLTLPATDSATESALLAEQAEARWGSDKLALAGLPHFPGKWYPFLTGIDSSITLGSQYYSYPTPRIFVDHGVGSASAFAYRDANYWYECWISALDFREKCGYNSDPADGPLWRINKGEAAWKPLTSIPKSQKSVYKDYGPGLIPWVVDQDNRWNQVAWSDLHKRWFFWVGSATGSVYLATEEAAEKLP